MDIENKKRRTERVRKVTIEQIEKALEKNAGILSLTAKHLEVVYGIKITRQALSYRVKKSKRLQNVRDEARETILDKAEGVLFTELAKGNWKVALSLLRTLGKNRGYGNENITINNSNIQTVPQNTEVDLSKFTKDEILKLTHEVFNDE